MSQMTVNMLKTCVLRSSNFYRGSSKRLCQSRRLFGSHARVAHQTYRASNSLAFQKFHNCVFAAGISLGGLYTSYKCASAATAAGPELALKLLLTQADDYYDTNEFDELYKILIPHKDEMNDEILWRLGRATYSRSLVTTDKKERDALVKEALTYAEKALSINENNFAVHKWMAILIDCASAIDGSKARIQQTFVVKKHMERACELNPKDGTSWYILASWHYGIADIPWYQRKAAAVLFATPPESSFDEALKYFLHAEELEPNFYSKNLLMIGKCYQKLNNKSEAVEYLKRARDYIKFVIKPTEDDKESQKEAQELLKQLGAS